MCGIPVSARIIPVEAVLVCRVPETIISSFCCFNEKYALHLVRHLLELLARECAVCFSNSTMGGIRNDAEICN